MLSFDCLHRESNLSGHYLLEASAGTGKTFALEQMTLRLLIEKENPLLLEEILIVTFTKAAVSDLKKRIRESLEKAIRLLRVWPEEKEKIPDYLLALLEKKEKKEILHLLESALFFYDQSQIFTMHGFSARMLQEFAFEAKRPSLSSLEESENEKVLLKDLFEDLVYDTEEREVFCSEQVSLILKKSKNIKKIVDKLSSSGRKKEEFLPVFQLVKQSNEILARCPEDPEKIRNAFEEIFPYFKVSSFDKEALFQEVSLIEGMVKKKKMTLPELEKLLATKLSLSSFLSCANKKSKGPSYEELLSSSSFFGWIQEELYPLLEKGISFSSLFSLLHLSMQEKMEAELKKQGTFSFDLLLKEMRQAMDIPGFKEKVRKKYRAVMIDEFQDTDPLQWEIFRTLFLEKQAVSSFFLVGDPKQSIYRFRKADLYTYYQAAEFLTKKSHYLLDTNYRSIPSLVEALNALFSPTFSSCWLTLPKWNQELPYSSVKAGKKEEDSFSDQKAPLHFFIAKSSSEKKSYYPGERNFFSYLIQEIGRLHKEEQIAYQEIAILVKDRYQMERLKAFLLEKKLPFRSQNRKSWEASEALWAFGEFLEALFEEEEGKRRRALLGPYLGWSLEELGSDYEKRESEILNNFYRLKDLLQKEGLPHFFREFLSSSWKKEGTTILEEMALRKDASFYADTLQLFELLEQNSRERGVSFYSLTSFLQHLGQIGGEEKTEMLGESEGVQIMTLHGAKGLEFTIVFALGVAALSYVFEEEEASEEEDAEKMRQFYVALTRAKKRCYLPLVGEEEKKIERGKTSAIDLFASYILHGAFFEKIFLKALLEKLDLLKAKNHVSYEWIEEKPFFPIRAKEEKELLAPPPILLPSSAGKLFSFSTISKKEGERREDLLVDDQYPFSAFHLPLGKEMGILVHRIFAKIFSTESSKNSEKIVQEELLQTTFGGYERKIHEMVSLALNIPLPSENGSFCLKEIEAYCAEMEFLYSLSGSKDLMKGSIDLFFLHGGKYYFVDWKTNWLGDSLDAYLPSSLKKAMEEHHYFLQASIYQEALKRFMEKMLKTDFETSFGGAFYIFLRGLSSGDGTHGVFAFQPDKIQRESSLCIEPLL